MTSAKEKFVKDFKKRIYTFALRLIEFLDKLPADMPSKRIGDQLLRSGTSIPVNYVEGQSASSKKDFTNYLTTSLKSANESKMRLALLRDSKRAKPEAVARFLSGLDEVSRILASGILKCKGKR